MTGRPRLIEHIKTALIIVLVISAVWLVSRTGLITTAEPQGGLAAEDLGTSVQTAAYPTAAAVSLSDGFRCAVQYDSAAVQSIVAAFEPVLTEALGSAFEPLAVTEEEWRACLTGDSLYLEYPAELPLELVAAWFGTDCRIEDSARRIMLTKGAAGEISLVYMDDDGGIYACPSSASGTGFEEAAQGCSANDGRFAWELSTAYAGFGDYNIVMETPRIAQALDISRPAGAEMISRAVETFEINENSDLKYTETDGTVVYVEGDCVIRLTSDGHLSYRRTEAGDRFSLDEGAGPVQAVELARRIVAGTAGTLSGIAEPQLTELTETSGGWVIRFTYFVNGAELIATSGGYAAQLEFEGGMLRYASIDYLLCSGTGESSVLLPELQAAAAAGDTQEIVLRYIDRGADPVTAEWTVKAVSEK